MNSTLSKRSFQAIYRFLDFFNPVSGDCGLLCGAACCTCSSAPDADTPLSESDENADYSMGLYLLPGEESIFDGTEDWISWGSLDAEDYDFPESWTGRVPFLQCTKAPYCDRKKRPVQCRTYPLAPYLNENGELLMIFQQDPLPYECPLVTDRASHPLNEDFVKATWTCWKHLIRDPLIFDLVEYESWIREDEGYPIETVYPAP